MKLKPVNNRILIQLHFPDESDKSKLVLPDRSLSASVEDQRTLVECLGVGCFVNERGHVCDVGDFLLLHPDAMRNAIATKKEPAQMLIDAGVVLAVVEDDVRLPVVLPDPATISHLPSPLAPPV